VRPGQKIFGLIGYAGPLRGVDRDAWDGMIMEILGQPRQPLLDLLKAIVEIERQAELDGDPRDLIC